MLSHCLRRADSADRTFHFVPLLGLILLLAAPLAHADEPGSEEEVAEPAAPAAVVASDAADEAPLAHAVGPVTVTATRAERDILEVPGNVTVIEREEIERSGVGTVADLMRRQSGLFVINRSTNPTDFVVDARGFNNGGGNGGNLLVQVDGRRVLEPDLGVADWSLLPLDSIESIEIVRGATSAIYGDNATAGVVNIRTRPQEGPPRGTVRGRVGSYDTGGGSLRASASVGPVTGSLFLDGLLTDGYRKQSFYSGQNYEGTLEWNVLDRVLLGARGGYHEDFRELPGALTQDEIDTYGRRAVALDNLGDETNLTSGFFHGWLEAILAEDVELTVRPFWRDRASENTSTFDLFGAATTFLLDTDVAGAGVDTQLRVDKPLFGRRNRLIAGGEFLHEERQGASRSPGWSQDTDGKRDVYSVFVQDEFYLTETLLLAAGVRFDRAEYDILVEFIDSGIQVPDNPTYSEWSPRASLTWRVLPTLSVYGTYARGFRLPTLDEASPFFGEPPGLDAQVSDAGEIGVKFRSGRAEASLALYLMMVKDEILYNPFPPFENENLDRVRHRGIEAAFNFRILEWLWTYANYTFDDVKIVEAGDALLEGARMPITPKHRGTVGLFAKLPYDVEFTANANIVDERILANDFNRQLPPLDMYGTLDFLLAWRPHFGEHVSGALTFALRNATGEEYEDFGVRSEFPTTHAEFYPAATRTWEVGFMLTLRK